VARLLANLQGPGPSPMGLRIACSFHSATAPTCFRVIGACGILGKECHFMDGRGDKPMGKTRKLGLAVAVLLVTALAGWVAISALPITVLAGPSPCTSMC
jgi:hypothetical protein